MVGAEILTWLLAVRPKNFKIIYGHRPKKQNVNASSKASTRTPSHILSEGAQAPCKVALQVITVNPNCKELNMLTRPWGLCYLGSNYL